MLLDTGKSDSSVGHLILTIAPPIDGCHHCYESKISCVLLHTIQSEDYRHPVW